MTVAKAIHNKLWKKYGFERSEGLVGACTLECSGITPKSVDE